MKKVLIQKYRQKEKALIMTQKNQEMFEQGLAILGGIKEKQTFRWGLSVIRETDVWNWMESNDIFRSQQIVQQG